MNEMHEANRKAWDAVSPYWQKKVDASKAKEWRKCHLNPTIALNEKELEYLGDVSNKTVCVLGSGDNLVVFALAGLGAKVVSVDISQVQLEIAAKRADELRLEISFVRADVTDLFALADETFDIVYTGGHVAVWVSDLEKYYSEATRILKPKGVFLVNEYHPFRRIWRGSPNQLEVEFDYFDRGPHRYDRSDEVPRAKPGSLPSYEFHWSVSDYAAAMLGAGCELLAIDEIGVQKQDWEAAPVEGLPECLILVGKKRTL